MHQILLYMQTLFRVQFLQFNGCLDIVLVLRKRNNATPLLSWVPAIKNHRNSNMCNSQPHETKNWLHSVTLLRGIKSYVES